VACLQLGCGLRMPHEDERDIGDTTGGSHMSGDLGRVAAPIGRAGNIAL